MPVMSLRMTIVALQLKNLSSNWKAQLTELKFILMMLAY